MFTPETIISISYGHDMEANRTQSMELILVIDAKVTSTELNLQM